MKRIVLMAALALLGTGSISAQRGGGRPRMTVEQQVNQLKQELNLTSDQVKKVTALYTDHQKKMEGAGEKSREQMRSERENLNKQVEALLTDKQKTAFREMQARQRGQGKASKNK